MSASMAGGSAASKARELRAKAARLEEEARQWDKGAEGERRTAAVLSRLGERGYVVLDDLSIPGSKANIDHVVIGPTGVVVIETKAYTGRLNVSNGVLWHGRYPLRKELAAATFEADKVRDVVASTGWSVTVRSLMCVHGVDVPVDSASSLAPVELCGPLDLLARIEAAAPRLGPEHVGHLVNLIEQALPPQRIPAPPPPPEPSQATPAVKAGGRTADVLPLRRPSRRGPVARPAPQLVSALGSGLREAGKLALRVVLGLIAIALMLQVAQASLEAMGDRVAKIATTTTSTTVPVPVDPGVTPAPPAVP